MSTILITVPVWNEAAIIEANLKILARACEEAWPDGDYMIEAADNGSTDGTGLIIERFAADHPRIRYRFMAERGKGGAIQTSWTQSPRDFDAFVFLDADLAADVRALPRLVAPILDGTADIVVGSRFFAGSAVKRSWLREGLSRGFRIWQYIILDLPVRDAQCGFKAVSPRVVRDVVPKLSERAWLFDSELLAFAAHDGFRIREIPVDWIERRNPARRSAIRLWKDGKDFLTGVLRIRSRLRKLSTPKC
jgi:glycosyltransferase involved in cell wall biosynthesis